MTVHVAGAGLAGLAAAFAASERDDDDIIVHEAAPQAGGRCRTVESTDGLGPLDNGAHVILGGNRSAFAWLEAIGAQDRVVPAADDVLPFIDLASKRRRQVPITGHPLDLLLYPRALRPFMRAVFNAPPRSVSLSKCLKMAGSLIPAGRGALRPWIARESLTETFIAPALDTLSARGVRFLARDRLNGVTLSGGYATAAGFSAGTAFLGKDDVLILALPPGEIARLLPGTVDSALHPSPIVNVHFRFDAPPPFPGGAAMLGLTGGCADWMFMRGHILTVMRSAAHKLVEREGAWIAAAFWRDAALAQGVDAVETPVNRVIKERHATWNGTSLRRRLLPSNVRIAGDWCVRGLPCCIEAAIRSGIEAGAYPCR